MYSPLYSFTPFDLFGQQHIHQQPSWYFQQSQPEEYLFPEHIATQPSLYRYPMMQPRHCHSQQPGKCYVLPSRHPGPLAREFLSPRSTTGYMDIEESQQPFEVRPGWSEDEQSSDSEQDVDLGQPAFTSSQSTHSGTQQVNERSRSRKRSHDTLKPQQPHKKRSGKEKRRDRKSKKTHRKETKRWKEAVQQFRYNRAVKLIQRQWRLYQQKRREEASRKIVGFIHARLEIRQAQQVLQHLRQLRSFETELDLTHERQAPRVFKRPLKFASDSTPESIKIPPVKENQCYLGYEDALLRLLMRIDGVDSIGSDIVRHARKSLVNKTQSLLDQLDEFKKSQYSTLVTSRN
ncbi:hypothetical protein K493DRAFT_354357 [Basidiobolus meristosporus CBS 931.73]|uniref:BAG domain-containing protein n=1 Tax=Basidiobolus meristosporus CBS 931.73 TaxID=1314790 RepID=A0A1Y1Y3V2_9FUNG|nr:hypothetical protein K493DRAFT_354357 [Basidiobolus meristosporus CBS 931.73]|eukprot:ORX92565.1 hypothetical protein K493DRAFT_354357 [Basidiobolus meristosporus CBS 931.73]